MKKAAWLAAVAALAACAGPASRLKDGRVEGTIDQNPERGSYYEAIGIGAADPALATDTQRKAVARDAAVVKAQHELLSMLKGVGLSGSITVAQAMEQDSEITARLDETIRGARIVKSEFTSDDGCVVTLRLAKRDFARLMAEEALR